jgi:hypothetical protein
MNSPPWGCESDDVVEDSEPEREALRRKEKEEKRRAKFSAKISRQDTETIELSDTEFVASALRNAADTNGAFRAKNL